jgi:hypothetical protein
LQASYGFNFNAISHHNAHAQWIATCRARRRAAAPRPTAHNAHKQKINKA